ncbi:M28 family peptidase [Chitinophaga oryziterrae]
MHIADTGTYALIPPPVTLKLLQDFDSVRLRDNLLLIGKERNQYSASANAHLETVRKLILKSFSSGGMSSHTQSFSVQNYQGMNIIGELYAKNRSTRGTLIIGAHYDTVEGSAGVDDNATGVATLIELARILSHYDFKYNIRFVAFDLEEAVRNINGHGGTEGSKAFVEHGGILNTDSIIGFINLDMLGYYTSQKNSQQFPQGLKTVFPDLYKKVEKNEFRGDFLLSFSNDRSRSLARTVEESAHTYIPELSVINIPVPGNGEGMDDFRRSDHVHFWDNGYSAISLGDGAYSRNPHYHSPEDKFQDINEHFLGMVTKLLLLTVATQCEINIL